MRIATLLSILLLFFSAATAQKKNSLQQINMVGKVKLVKETDHSVLPRPGEPKEDSIQSVITFRFNEQGNDEEWISYYPDGSERVKRTFSYDEKGNDKEQIMYSDDGIDHTVYLYDGNGNMIEVKTYYVDDMLGDTVVTSKSVYLYDSKGNVIDEKNYNDWNLLEDRKSSVYDDKGNVIEEGLYGATYERYLGKYTFKYDDRGNNTEGITYDPSGILLGRSVFSYDEKNNQVEWHSYSPDGSLNGHSSTSYTYDNTGNWIRQVYYKEDKPETITTRIIEYY